MGASDQEFRLEMLHENGNPIVDLSQIAAWMPSYAGVVHKGIRAMKRRQIGFTLVEIAIILVMHD